MASSEYERVVWQCGQRCLISTPRLGPRVVTQRTKVGLGHALRVHDESGLVVEASVCCRGRIHGGFVVERSGRARGIGGATRKDNGSVGIVFVTHGARHTLEGIVRAADAGGKHVRTAKHIHGQATSLLAYVILAHLRDNHLWGIALST